MSKERFISGNNVNIPSYEYLQEQNYKLKQVIELYKHLSFYIEESTGPMFEQTVKKTNDSINNSINEILK